MNDLQRTPEWFSARLGKLGASRIDEATARTKTGWGASRANLMAELLIERLTGQPAPRFTNASMEWGIEHEAEAITVYEVEKIVTVDQVGFIAHPSIADAGASPDGLVNTNGQNGQIEAKCPNSATHIETLLSGSIDKHEKQIQFQLSVTGREWCDFISYDPRMPINLRVFIRRVYRDDKMIAKLEADACEFLRELAERHERLVNFTSLPPTMDQVAAVLKASVEALGA